MNDHLVAAVSTTFTPSHVARLNLLPDLWIEWFADHMFVDDGVFAVHFSSTNEWEIKKFHSSDDGRHFWGETKKICASNAVDEPPHNLYWGFQWAATFDDKSKTIWVQYNETKILSISLEGEIVHYGCKVPLMHYPAMQIVGDSLHIVGNDPGEEADRFRHIIMNTMDGSVRPGYRWHIPFRVANVICVEGTKSLLAFGSLLPYDDMNIVFEYSLENEEWTEVIRVSAQSIGMHFLRTAAVKSPDGRYVFIFGGRVSSSNGYVMKKVSNHIAVFDVHSETFRRTSMVIPPVSLENPFRTNSTDEGPIKSIVYRDRVCEVKLALEYIDKLYGTKEFQDVEPLPEVLIDIISQMIAVDYVYNMEIGNGYFHRIAVDAIIDSIE